MKFLFDTNVLSALVKNQSSSLNQRFLATTPEERSTSEVVWHEVQFGLASNPAVAQKLGALYAALFKSMAVLPVARSTWLRAANLRAVLKAKGTPVGPYDLLVAATALEQDAMLITRNVREFGHVAGLRLESWA